MRKTLVNLALAGTLAVTGAALFVPGSALAQTADGTPRLTALTDALTGLVGDGTLTQSQADKVATTLDSALPGKGLGGGPEGRGPGRGPGGAAHVGPQEVAKALGISTDELRTQREAGKTLTQIAATKGITKDGLISRLVSAAKAKLATAVTEKRLTQAQADTVAAGLQARITEQVDHVGRRGPGKDGKDGKDGDREGSTTPSSASPAPSAKSS